MNNISAMFWALLELTRIVALAKSIYRWTAVVRAPASGVV
jgi:hypothetical protein